MKFLLRLLNQMWLQLMLESELDLDLCLSLSALLSATATLAKDKRMQRVRAHTRQALRQTSDIQPQR